MIKLLIKYKWNNISKSVLKLLTKMDMGWTWWLRLVNSATWVVEAGE